MSATGGSPEVRTARRSGEEYLLKRGLFRRKSTGVVVQPAYLEFAFPYYWHYDALRALDYFRRSGAAPEPRMAEAVAVVQSKRQPDGRWLLDRIHPGRVHFDLEGGVGTPSRWNTLRALRVLKSGRCPAFSCSSPPRTHTILCWPVVGELPFSQRPVQRLPNRSTWNCGDSRAVVN